MEYPTSHLTQQTQEHRNVSLPFSNPVTSPVHLLVLDRRNESNITDSRFYFLQGERQGFIKAFLDGDLSILSTLKAYKSVNLDLLSDTAKTSIRQKLKARGEELRGRYLPNVERFATELAEFVDEKSSEPPTLLVAVPSSRPHLIEPYLRAMKARFPSAGEVRLCRDAKWGSNSKLSLDERVGALQIESRDDNIDPSRVLIIDDVVASGDSVAAVLRFLQEHFAPTVPIFTIASVLRIES